MKTDTEQEQIDRLIEKLKGSIDFKVSPMKILKAIRRNETISA